MRQAIFIVTILLCVTQVRATPDPVYEYGLVLQAYLLVQRCSLDEAEVTAGFADAARHFVAGEFVSAEDAAAMRASLGSQVRRKWRSMSPEQRQRTCATQGARHAERLRGLLFEDAQ